MWLQNTSQNMEIRKYSLANFVHIFITCGKAQCFRDNFDSKFYVFSCERTPEETPLARFAQRTLAREGKLILACNAWCFLRLTKEHGNCERLASISDDLSQIII